MPVVAAASGARAAACFKRGYSSRSRSRFRLRAAALDEGVRWWSGLSRPLVTAAVTDTGVSPEERTGAVVGCSVLGTGAVAATVAHVAVVVVGVFAATPTSSVVVGVAVPGAHRLTDSPADPQQLWHVVVVVVVGVFAPIPTRSVVPGPGPRAKIQESLKHSQSFLVALLSDSAGWDHAVAYVRGRPGSAPAPHRASPLSRMVH